MVPDLTDSRVTCTSVAHLLSNAEARWRMSPYKKKSQKAQANCRVSMAAAALSPYFEQRRELFSSTTRRRSLPEFGLKSLVASLFA